MFSSKISSLLNSDLDQSARNNFLADLTDSIESVTSSYLASYLRKISHQLLLDCFSSGIGSKSSLLWNKTLSARISQFLMELYKAVFYHPYFSLFDELLTRLEPEAVGCYWSHCFVGVFGYADDIVLLTPSASALRMMLNTYCQFADDYLVQVFNSPYLAPHLAHLHH